MDSEKDYIDVSVSERPRTPSLKSPRTARFAEATQVISPVDGKSPFADPPTAEVPTNHYHAQPQPGDIGFGYISQAATSPQGAEIEETDRNYLPPVTPRSLKSPLKSAMKSPGAAPKSFLNPLSPTFREEQVLEKTEGHTDVQQAKDVAIKTRVRMAKMVLRGVNFSCSLIVLSMLATTFNIFNATKALPARSNFPPWAQGQKIWPQVTVLVIACVSLAFSIIVMYGYWRGGHKRAEKVAVYYTTFSVVFFIFSIVMWLIGAGVLNQSKANGGGKDMWGWSCVDNKRKSLFEDAVNYNLVCRLQNWSLVCCIIEVIVEVITIAIYSIVFYRYYSKRRLRKSMAKRDKARSDLYLAQLRTQSAPNTPGLRSPMSMSMTQNPLATPALYARGPAAEEGAIDDGVRYITVDPTQRVAPQPKPFALQAPPTRHTPRAHQNGFDSSSPTSTVSTSSPSVPIPAAPMSPQSTGETRRQHVAAAPGEQVYAAVPIPGAYEPLRSPTAAVPRTPMPFPGYAQ